jgi:hypothetical protein
MFIMHVSSGMLTFATIDSDEMKFSALFSRRARRELSRTAKAIIRTRLMAETEDESTPPPPTYAQAIGRTPQKTSLVDANKMSGSISLPSEVHGHRNRVR